MKDLHLLLSLQDHDAAIDELAHKIADIDSQILVKKNLAGSLKAGLSEAKQILQTHQSAKKQLEIDAAEIDAKIRKHHNELNTLKSNDAYKAMLDEIKNEKDAFSNLEDQQLELMEKIETAETDYKAKEEKLKSEEGKLLDEAKALEEEKAKIQSELKTKQDSRNEFSKTVPQNLLLHYENVRKRKGGLVLAAVIDGTCSECNMKIRPNQMVQLKKAKTIEYCEQSAQILYLPEHVQQQADASPQVTQPIQPTEANTQS